MKKAEKYGDYPVDDTVLGEEIAELRAGSSFAVPADPAPVAQIPDDAIDTDSEEVF
jgi:hypothetical protein